MTSGDVERCLDRGGTMAATHFILVPLYSKGIWENLRKPIPLPMGLKEGVIFMWFVSVVSFKSHSTLVIESELEVISLQVKVVLDPAAVTTLPRGCKTTEHMYQQNYAQCTYVIASSYVAGLPCAAAEQNSSNIFMASNILLWSRK